MAALPLHGERCGAERRAGPRYTTVDERVVLSDSRQSERRSTLPAHCQHLRAITGNVTTLVVGHGMTGMQLLQYESRGPEGVKRMRLRHHLQQL